MKVSYGTCLPKTREERFPTHNTDKRWNCVMWLFMCVVLAFVKFRQWESNNILWKQLSLSTSFQYTSSIGILPLNSCFGEDGKWGWGGGGVGNGMWGGGGWEGEGRGEGNKLTLTKRRFCTTANQNDTMQLCSYSCHIPFPCFKTGM